MTTTDRRDAEAADLSVAEQARLDRIETTPACDEDTVERVARAICNGDAEDHGTYTWDESCEELRDDYRRSAAHAIDALKPAPGTDTSTEDALHRVLDLADDIDGAFEIYGDEVARRIREAISGATDE